MRTAWEIYSIVIDAKMQNEKKILKKFLMLFLMLSLWCYFCQILFLTSNMYFKHDVFWDFCLFPLNGSCSWLALYSWILPRRPPSGLTCFKGTLTAVNKTGTTASCTAMNILEHLSTNQSQEFNNPIV